MKEIIAGLEWEIGPECGCGGKTVYLKWKGCYGCLNCREEIYREVI